MEKDIEKIFYKKDFFYNNGIANLKMFIDNYEFNEIKDIQLADNYLKIILSENDEKALFDKIYGKFLEEYKIVHQTNNERIYWDNENKQFIIDKKFDVVGKTSGNDVKNLYKSCSAEQIGKSVQELDDQFIKFAKENELKEKTINDYRKNFVKDNKYKTNDKCSLILYFTISEAVKSFIDYSLPNDFLDINSKIHQFEDGGFCFRDFVKSTDEKINKWDALIYWFGVKIKRYYNANYYLYINSQSLKSLLKIKNNLKFIEDKIKYKDKKSGKIVTTQTNIDMYNQLISDGINNHNFYISNSEEEFKLKFFMYLFSYIYHIEDKYKNSTVNRQVKKTEKLFKSIQETTYVSYTQDGNLKSALNEYSKTYKLFKFFNILIDYKYKNISLFKYFSDIITVISLSKGRASNNIVNLNIKKFSNNILNFSPIRKNYFEASFDILKNDTLGFGEYLFYIEKEYLKFTVKEDIIMSLHDKSKILGDQIGYFAANIESKDLLFKLRNVKNHKQLVTFFKDLKFECLKNDDKANFKKEFDEVLTEILSMLDKNTENWELIRDYTAIYAVNKFRAVAYAKKAK